MLLARINLIKNFFIYLVISGLPFYYFLREYGSSASIIYSITLALLFFICFFQDFQNHFTKRNFLNTPSFLEVLILCNILFVTIFLKLWDKNLILLFVILLITKNLFSQHSKENFSSNSNALIISALITGAGVALGFLELLFFDSHIFNQVMGFDYPYSDGTNETILINGFFPSANSSAYCIVAGLAFTQYQNIFKGNSKYFLYFLLGTTLLLTKTKFGFLFTFSLLGIYFINNYSKSYLVFYLCSLALSYIFLSHIMIAPNGSYDYPSLHFRRLLFSVGSIDFILGNYGMFKVFSFEAISSNIFFPIGLSNFEETYGGRPHFMIGGIIISGGLSLAIFLSLYLLIYLKKNFKNLSILIKNNYLYSSALICFLVETVNWNFGNNIYFWAIIMGLGSAHLMKKNLT